MFLGLLLFVVVIILIDTILLTDDSNLKFDIDQDNHRYTCWWWFWGSLHAMSWYIIYECILKHMVFYNIPLVDITGDHKPWNPGDLWFYYKTKTWEN